MAHEWLTIQHDGRERTCLVYPAKADGLLPLVLVLHGGGGNAENAERMSDMSAKADAEGFIAAYPNGTGVRPKVLLTWNAGHCCGHALENRVDDTGYFSRLITDIKRSYPVDPARIYVTGISNGAMMAHRLACDLSTEIAAIAPVAGTISFDGCAPSSPVSVMIFHGTADEHAPYKGGVGSKTIYPRVDRPVAEAVEFWRRINRCFAPVRRDEAGGTTIDIYGGGAEGSEVALITLNGQGHAWPGGKPGLKYGNVDMPSQQISATDMMWDFFKRHRKTR